MERLDKIISKCMNISRSDASKKIRSGEIEVDSETKKDPSEKFDENMSVFSSGGIVLSYNKFIYIMMNKPEGVISASEGKDETTVIDILPEKIKRNGLFPAGRLDRNTTGFCLITDDGMFAHEILSPKRHVEKEYVFETDNPISKENLEKIRKGISTGGSVFRPCEINETGVRTYDIILKEGKYHEIKKMAHFAGAEVIKLKRIRIGSLFLDENLKPGDARILKREEVLKIRN